MVRIIVLACLVVCAVAQLDQDLFEAGEAIWAVDYNRFTEDEVEYDLGSSDQLFTYVNDSRLETGTYPAMMTMLTLYNPQIGEPDPDLTAEIELFLDELMPTPCMDVVWSYVQEWGLMEDNATAWRDAVREHWFGRYSRSTGGILDSCGFEHVFQGQIEENRLDIVGFHNWVQTYKEEQRELFFHREGYADCGNDLVGISDFEWRGATKPLSSMWIGTSPEVEIALYTMCHLAKRDLNCYFSVAGGINSTITTYGWPNTEMVSSAYPRCSFSLSDEELGQATEAIYLADNNSFQPDEYTYDVNGTTLFTNVDESRFETGLYPLTIDLLDKFNPHIGEADPNLDVEIEAFLDVLLETDVMKTAQEYLIEWGRASSDANTWRDDVREYWFGKYTRSNGDALDSSGFEHAFQGQIRNSSNELTGFNNWIQAYKEEQKGEFRYGFSELDCGDDLIEINAFTWLGAFNPISSLWIGRSPELEIALYTVCFQVRRNENCDIMINGQPERIINYDIEGTNFIGSVYMLC